MNIVGSMSTNHLTRSALRRNGRSESTTRELRDAMGRYASGVTVVTGYDADGPIGFTCQSFYSVSLEPPLISICVMRSSSSYPRIREAGRFCVNVLAHNQHELSNQFARRGTDKWSGVDWGITASGDPVLDSTLLWVDCELEAEYEVGDHLIVIGRVTELSPDDWHPGDPLVFFKGGYRTLQRTERRARAWICDE